MSGEDGGGGNFGDFIGGDLPKKLALLLVRRMLACEQHQHQHQHQDVVSLVAAFDRGSLPPASLCWQTSVQRTHACCALVVVVQGLLIFTRVGVYLRLDGVDVDRFSQAMAGSGIMGYIDTLSGGGLPACLPAPALLPRRSARCWLRGRRGISTAANGGQGSRWWLWTPT